MRQRIYELNELEKHEERLRQRLTEQERAAIKAKYEEKKG